MPRPSARSVTRHQSALLRLPCRARPVLAAVREEQRYRGILARRSGADAGVKDLVVAEHGRVGVGPAPVVGQRSGRVQQPAPRASRRPPPPRHGSTRPAAPGQRPLTWQALRVLIRLFHSPPATRDLTSYLPPAISPGQSARYARPPAQKISLQSRPERRECGPTQVKDRSRSVKGDASSLRSRPPEPDSPGRFGQRQQGNLGRAAVGPRGCAAR